MNTQPAVSCICLTYARPELLEEAIYSFLQQDYLGSKELIVLNDYDQQILTFDHPEVQIINVPKRFCTVGEKMNIAVALASHDLLFVWDDDDIYLPHRLTFSVVNLELERGFFKPNQAWFLDNGQLSGPATNIFHVGSCYTRNLFNAIQGYPAMGTGYDLVFEEKIQQKFPDVFKPFDIRPEDIYYLYRWGGTGSYHMSAFGDNESGKNIGHDNVGAFVQEQMKHGEIEQGHIALNPRWKLDYLQLVADYYTATLSQASALRATCPSRSVGARSRRLS